MGPDRRRGRRKGDKNYLKGLGLKGGGAQRLDPASGFNRCPSCASFSPPLHKSQALKSLVGPPLSWEVIPHRETRLTTLVLIRGLPRGKPNRKYRLAEERLPWNVLPN